MEPIEIYLWAASCEVSDVLEACLTTDLSIVSTLMYQMSAVLKAAAGCIVPIPLGHDHNFKIVAQFERIILLLIVILCLSICIPGTFCDARPHELSISR